MLRFFRKLTPALVLLFAFTVTGCSQNGATNPVTPKQVVDVAKNAVKALSSTLAQVSSVATIPPATVAQINQALADASSVLGSLSDGMAASAAAPVVQQVETDLNAVIAAAAMIPGVPPPFSVALTAAAVALPILETFVNTILPAPAAASPAAATARAKFADPNMTPSEGAAKLAELAGKR